jgi:methionyl-tRNA formyltransferase
MRIVIVGQGPFGEKVLEALIQKGEDIVGTFSPPDKRGEGMKALAEKSGIPFFCPGLMKDPQVYDHYAKLKPELATLAFVTDIIQGATRTGLTVFWVDKGIDTGPILLQKEVEIKPEDTTGSLYFNRLFPMGIDAMVEAVELIKKGKAPRIPQDDSKATYEPPCDDRVASVNFEKPIKAIYNLIRGCDPQPGAYTIFNGKKVRFYDAKLCSPSGEKSNGVIVSIQKEGLQITAKGGIIEIGKLRVDKGEKIGPIEFVKSVDLKIGDRFGK